MIQQLVQRLIDAGSSQEDAASTVLESDPLDLVLHLEQVWDQADLWNEPHRPAGPARRALSELGRFRTVGPASGPAWNHIGYAYVLENTRAVQILRRVVKEFREGESLGIPQRATLRWLDATEALLFGGFNLFGPWLETSAVRPNPEATRRNAYWRMFGADLAFGSETNTPAVFEKAAAANTEFVPVFEELLRALRQAMANVSAASSGQQPDDDRIFRIAEQLAAMLRARRRHGMLAREELAAVTALGWVHLTLSTNSPVVVDLRADASSPGERLELIGERVALAPHRRAEHFFAMATDLSLLLRTLEAGYISGPEFAWLLYADAPSQAAGAAPAGVEPIGAASRRVITEWSAATGRSMHG
jgi:hypothetical protein